MTDKDHYAQVIIPLAVEGFYTYLIPRSLRERIMPGSRVLVPFGKKRIYSAIVRSIQTGPPDGIQIREIMGLLDDGIGSLHTICVPPER
jgi:primosomal protein N' (replication factor Y)